MLQFRGLQRVRHNLATEQQQNIQKTHTYKKHSYNQDGKVLAQRLTHILMKQNRGSKEQICTHMDNCFMEKVTKYFNGEKERLF